MKVKHKNVEILAITVPGTAVEVSPRFSTVINLISCRFLWVKGFDPLTYDQMHKHDEDGDTQKLSLYDQMPHQFSRDQLNEQCVKLGLSPGRTFLHKWKKAKLIHQPNPGEEIYIKNY